MMKRADYLKLLTFLHQVEVKSLAEIGVWTGLNALELRKLFPKTHLYLIDPWELSPNYVEEGAPPDFDSHLYQKAYECTKWFFRHDPNVTILKKTSTAALSDVPDDLDLVFIDGDHSYRAVKSDIHNWSQKVRSRGIISGHDYHPDFPGVVRAVNECLPNQFEVGDDDVWSTIKT